MHHLLCIPLRASLFVHPFTCIHSRASACRYPSCASPRMHSLICIPHVHLCVHHLVCVILRVSPHVHPIMCVTWCVSIHMCQFTCITSCVSLCAAFYVSVPSCAPFLCISLLHPLAFHKQHPIDFLRDIITSLTSVLKLAPEKRI